MSFGALVAERVAARESQIVVGLDPDPDALWHGSWDGDLDGNPVAARSAEAVFRHCVQVLDSVAPAVVGVKLQLACFERLGAPGWVALADTCVHARDLGLLVIADGKRGDIDVSASAYAQGLFGGLSTARGPISGLGVDAATVAPYMGTDTVRPFVDAARTLGSGVFVLVRTSNPGAAELEDALLADGRPVWEAAAAMVAELTDTTSEPLGDVGAVVGATAPEQLVRAREVLPRAIFLLPGVGAQGGHVSDLAAAFSPGRAGGLVTVSRAIVDAEASGSGGARRAAESLREACWGLDAG